jgi:ornithine decarboxylase
MLVRCFRRAIVSQRIHHLLSGTGAFNTSAYVNAIRHAKIVFGYGKSLGFDMNLLDIGGGFQDCNMEDIACSLRPMLKEEFPSGVRLIAEPGRYYARSAYTLACKVLSRRRHIGTDDHDKPDMLYQNDGVYGSFMNVLIEKETVRPSLVAYTWPFHSHGNDTRRKLEEHRYTIWGPTCDSVDCVAKDVPMNSEIRIGDWLKYKNMGGESLHARLSSIEPKTDYPWKPTPQQRRLSSMGFRTSMT